MMNFQPAPPPVRMGQRLPYRPARRQKLSQIDIRPEINAPINIGLGSLPIVIGSFTGAVVVFLLGNQAPSLKPFTTVVSVGLAGFGIFNLFSSDVSAAVPGGDELPGSASPAGGGDSSVSPAIAPTSEEAFPLINGRVMSPTEFQTVEQSPFINTVPVRVRLTNPSSVPVTFDMELEVHEIPTQLLSGEATSAESTRVSLGAGETRDIDVSITLTTWGFMTDLVDVYLTVRKRRVAGGAAEVLAATHFIVD